MKGIYSCYWEGGGHGKVVAMTVFIANVHKVLFIISGDNNCNLSKFQSTIHLMTTEVKNMSSSNWLKPFINTIWQDQEFANI